MSGQEEGEEEEEEEELHCQEGKQVQELAQIAGLLCLMTRLIPLDFTRSDVCRWSAKPTGKSLQVGRGCLAAPASPSPASCTPRLLPAS